MFPEGGFLFPQQGRLVAESLYPLYAWDYRDVLEVYGSRTFTRLC